MYYYSNLNGLVKVAYNSQDKKYHIPGSNVTIKKELLFETKENAILDYYSRKIDSYNKEMDSLNQRIKIIEDTKEKLRKKLDIDELKEKYPEKFMSL